MPSRPAEQDLLRPYLPRLVTRWLTKNPESTHREVDGTIVFVDISGFTRLSERLAKRGKVGAEELTDAIDACFARLLGVAYGNGGGLIKFGGDALLLLFAGDDHAAKACRAAVGMRRALREIGSLSCPGGRVTLRMSQGVHSGTFHFFLVGESHRELIIAGPAASETVLMEQAAEAGEIVVSAATAATLDARCLGAAKGSGTLLRREPPGLSAERTDFIDHADAPSLLPCIPLGIREQLLAGLDEPEHKRITVAFIHFDGSDELIAKLGPDQAADHVGDLVRDVQRAVDRQGICFLGSDIDHDGGKIILTAGAPAATENDEERMLLALAEILAGDRDIPVRAGVNRGSVFAGNVGPPYRRTYTVMGDAVNLAARLMARAEPGRLVATEAVLDGSEMSFATTPLSPFMVKGKTEPVHAFGVGAPKGPKRAVADVRGPLVGREEEMGVLTEALASAREGQGRVALITGDGGIGKTRLVEEFVRGVDVRAFQATCVPYEAAKPYAPFRSVLRTVMGIDESAGDADAASRLHEVVRTAAPHVLAWLPLVAIALGIDVPSTDDVDALSEEFRRARLQEATRDVLTAVLTEPAVLVFEDVHWMDEPSLHLLRYLSADLDGVPWMVCVTSRSNETFSPPPSGFVVKPRPLEEDDATALVEALTEENPIAPHDVTAIAKRSAGHPLFLRELLDAARATGGVEGLPESVEGLVTARIDRLSPHDRSVLRRVSVLGTTFTRGQVKAVLADLPGGGDPNWLRLSEFLVSESHAELRFRSAVFRDAAYEGLPFRLRRTLHAAAGSSIERGADDVDTVAELLSLHFFHARRLEEAWRYSRIAAGHALSAYATVEAAQFFERALDAAKGQPFAGPGDVATVHEALGDVRKRMGEFSKAEAAYGTARALRQGDWAATSGLLLKQARVKQVAGNYAGALRWLKRADEALPAQNDCECVSQRAQVAAAFASVRFDQGKYSDVIEWCTKAIGAAQEAGDRATLAHAYYLLDNAYIALGLGERAQYYPKALTIYEELGDLWGQGVVLNNMGTQAYWRAQWNDAAELYRRGQAARERIGDAVNAAFGTLNLGEILSDQGKPEEAEPLFRKALRVWRAAGDLAGVAYVLMNLGRMEARRGKYEEAETLLGQARAEFEGVGASADLVEVDARRAECLVLEGDPERGLEVVDRALDAAGAFTAPATQTPMLYRVKGWALEHLGRLSEARAAFEHSLRDARSRNLDYEVALTQRSMARLAKREGGADPEAAAESVAILERLGVIYVPDPPREPKREPVASRRVTAPA